MPVTGMFTAMHNMVTESVSNDWIAKDRKGYYCPVAVLEGLKKGLFAKDKEVQDYDLPGYDSVSGVPGLTSHHPAVSCASHDVTKL